MVELIQSKKFIASILASILALVGLLYGLPPSDIALVIAPLSIYIGAQVMADFGKEATKKDGKS